MINFDKDGGSNLLWKLVDQNKKIIKKYNSFLSAINFLFKNNPAYQLCKINLTSIIRQEINTIK